MTVIYINVYYLTNSNSLVFGIVVAELTGSVTVVPVNCVLVVTSKIK